MYSRMNAAAINISTLSINSRVTVLFVIYILLLADDLSRGPKTKSRLREKYRDVNECLEEIVSNHVSEVV